MTNMNRRSFFGFLFAGATAAGASQALGIAEQQGSTERQRDDAFLYEYYTRTMRRLSATFYGAPYVENLDELKAHVAFIGVPFDLGTTARPGARFGPKGLRNATRSGFGAPKRGFYDFELEEWILKDVTMADVGDVNIVPADFMPNFDRITEAIKKILAKGSLPAVLGGDHSITFPVLRAYEGGKRKIHIIHFDSHLDFGDGREPVRYAHGNPMRRSSELPWISGLTSIGIRGLTRSTEAFEQGKQKGVQVIPALKAIRMGMKEVIASIPKADSYYVSVDVDVIDPSLSPATGTPVPGGFNYYQMKEALTEIAKKGKVVGFDFVEVAPEYDFAETTCRLTARLIIDFLGAIFKFQAA